MGAGGRDRVHGRCFGSIPKALQALQEAVLYWDKAKDSQFLNAFGLQLPTYASSDENLLQSNIQTNGDRAQADGPHFGRRMDWHQEKADNS